MKEMHKNVKDFEPHSALFVPDYDPLMYDRAILKASLIRIIKGGKIYFEINEALGEKMSELMAEYGYHEISIFKDINRKDRIAKGKRS